MRHKIRRIHFVGIGGAGMCGLAEVMRNLGYIVSGSDLREQPSLARLRAGGIEATVGHRAQNVAAADCVVYSGAVGEDNEERQAATARGIPVIPRAQMLGELLRFQPGIAVAGTHGKTTVASMIAAVLTAAGRDPTCVIGGALIGGHLGGGGGHARVGGGDFVVVEADESDASFLHLQPAVAVITNIDNDHLAAFNHDLGQLRAAFRQFVGNLPFYGAAIVCADDVVARQSVADLPSLRVIKYGFAEDAEVRGKNVRALESAMTFSVQMDGGEYAMHLPVAGRHNVQNALAACAAARELDIGGEAMQDGLGGFAGVGRRLQRHGEVSLGGRRVLLVDDYAHHPTEIIASLSALRECHPRRRLLLVFQPHRYTRTRDLFAPLANAVALADALVLLEVYPAGEEPLPQADAAALAAAVRLPGGDKPILAPTVAETPAMLKQTAKDGDLLVTMGAGDISALPALILEASNG